MSLPPIPAQSVEYQTKDNLDLYDSEALETLATQAAPGRHLRVLTRGSKAVKVCLCEDGYPGWISLSGLRLIQVAQTNYHPPTPSLAEIQARLPQVIAFAQAAATRPNYYLWGGTIGPNYDCSGLVQQAFVSAGIWLPRDAYQQEAFTQAMLNPDHPLGDLSQLQPGDLIFFGPSQKATHVGIYLGERRYIHSSGKAQGRNGIGIDFLYQQGNAVTQTYLQQLRGAGRVVASYQPQLKSKKSSSLQA